MIFHPILNGLVIAVYLLKTPQEQKQYFTSSKTRVSDLRTHLKWEKEREW